MNRFSLVSRNDEISIKVAQTIQKKLLDGGMTYSDSEPEIVCIVGGDGTFLSAIHKYMDKLDSVYFTGVHTGTLGFFVDYNFKEMDECVMDILTKVPEIEEKHLLKITLKNANKVYYAVNEMRVESLKTQTIDVTIDGKKLQTYHGNGLSMSTQVGSTAYNRSLGGAIIPPNLNVMEMCEVAGIHHKHFKSCGNPIIFGEDNVVEFTSNSFNDAKLCFDRYILNLPQKESIECRLDKKCVKIAHYKQIEWTKHLEQLF